MTAHWVAKVKETTALWLKTALIVFHDLHSKHDGKTLAKTIVKLLDRAHITVNITMFHAAAITVPF
jgi:hypothetical protein